MQLWVKWSKAEKPPFYEVRYMQPTQYEKKTGFTVKNSEKEKSYYNKKSTEKKNQQQQQQDERRRTRRDVTGRICIVGMCWREKIIIQFPHTDTTNKKIGYNDNFY